MSLDKLDTAKTARWMIQSKDHSCSDIWLGALTEMFRDIQGINVARLTKQSLTVSLDLETEDPEKVHQVDHYVGLLDDANAEIVYRNVPEL